MNNLFGFFNGESDAVKAIRKKCEEDVAAQKKKEADAASTETPAPASQTVSDLSGATPPASGGRRRKTRRAKKSKRSRTGRKSSHP
jgi:hypothetical protein